VRFRVPFNRIRYEIVVKEVSEEDWPKGFFEEVLGNWEGEIERSA